AFAGLRVGGLRSPSRTPTESSALTCWFVAKDPRDVGFGAPGEGAARGSLSRLRCRDGDDRPELQAPRLVLLLRRHLDPGGELAAIHPPRSHGASRPRDRVAGSGGAIPSPQARPRTARRG